MEAAKVSNPCSHLLKPDVTTKLAKSMRSCTCRILKSKILIQFFIQDARTGETSWNLIVLKPRYYKHMQQEPSPELFLAFAAPSKSLNILSI